MTSGFPPGFVWDEGKNQANIAKHGIDFLRAVRIFERETLDREDVRHAYGETRINSLGWLDGEVVVNVTHTGRDGLRRLISARRASSGERRAYLAFVSSQQQP